LNGWRGRQSLIIKTENLDFRERKIEDFSRELEWKKDSEICYLEGLTHEGLTIPDYNLNEWISISSSMGIDKENLLLSIYYTPLNKHIGTIGFFPDTSAGITGEVGLIIGEKDYRGNGYGTEALKVFIDYIFTKLSVKKIYALVYNFNKKAYKIAIKTGFIEKGFLNRFSEKYGFYKIYRLELDRKDP